MIFVTGKGAMCMSFLYSTKYKNNSALTILLEDMKQLSNYTSISIHDVVYCIHCLKLTIRLFKHCMEAGKLQYDCLQL